MVTVWWFGVYLIHYSFLNPWKTVTSEKHILQTDEIHWKLQCLQPALANREGPIMLHDNARLYVTTNQCFKSWMNWAMKFLPPPYPTCSFVNWSPLLEASWQLFSRKMLPQPARGREWFLRLCLSNPEAQFLCYRNIFISCWKKYFDYNGSYFDQ